MVKELQVAGIDRLGLVLGRECAKKAALAANGFSALLLSLITAVASPNVPGKSAMDIDER